MHYMHIIYLYAHGLFHLAFNILIMRMAFLIRHLTYILMHMVFILIPEASGPFLNMGEGSGGRAPSFSPAGEIFFDPIHFFLIRRHLRFQKIKK